jgi:hypothetical protein
MKIASNTGPIIGLAKIDLLFLLKEWVIFVPLRSNPTAWLCGRNRSSKITVLSLPSVSGLPAGPA